MSWDGGQADDFFDFAPPPPPREAGYRFLGRQHLVGLLWPLCVDPAPGPGQFYSSTWTT